MINCSVLPLIRYITDERLEEIMQIHRDHGVFIADPHVYIVEDGKQGQVNPDVVATKMRFDPLGLLNPGKLRGWGQREQTMGGAASGTVRLTTLPRFWATPCRHRARRSGGEPGSAPLARSC